MFAVRAVAVVVERRPGQAAGGRKGRGEKIFASAVDAVTRFKYLSTANTL